MSPAPCCGSKVWWRFGRITSAFEEAGIFREKQETPEKYAFRTAEEPGEPGVARLGGIIYPYARFRNAVPAELVEEFDSLEPEALAAAERLKEAMSADRG